jgi:hypothetical protein
MAGFAQTYVGLEMSQRGLPPQTASRFKGAALAECAAAKGAGRAVRTIIRARRQVLLMG